MPEHTPIHDKNACDINNDVQGRASVCAEIEASATDVWEALQNFGDASAWFPEAQILGIEGQGVGAIRQVQIPTGEIYSEKCVEHEPASLRFSYVVLEGPMPCRNYEANVQIKIVDEQRSLVTWSCTFDASEDQLKDVGYIFEGSYESFFESLRTHFGDRN